MYMELPEHLPLADLKKAIKEFKTTQTPKLSSKKSVLMEYAARVGIVKSRETASASASMEDEEEPVTAQSVEAYPSKASSGKKAGKSVAVVRAEPVKPKKALPEVLKKPVAPAEVKTPKGGLKAPPEPEKPKGSPFALFMAQHKGQGLSMGQLAELYRRRK